jgi:23S rRNA U2552 (ribose-2'-O)-methylase RlmE/FtsJ
MNKIYNRYIKSDNSLDLIYAKKDKLFQKMKYLCDTYWELDKFDREEETKFFENEKELKNIGKQIFKNFNIKNINIEKFIDVCSAPGIYSKILLKKFTNSIGYGISLPINEGGIPFIINNERFNIIYKNIMDENYNLSINDKLDLGIGSCVSYTFDAKNAYFLNLDLIFKSLILILSNLKPNGNLIINLTIKNIDLAFNIINILNNMFSSFKLWKSSTIWVTKKTFYYFGYNFKNNFKEDILLDLIKRIRNNNDNINNQFIGTLKNYKKIYNQMKHIYNIRINAWEKLIAAN